MDKHPALAEITRYLRLGSPELLEDLTNLLNG